MIVYKLHRPQSSANGAAGLILDPMDFLRRSNDEDLRSDPCGEKAGAPVQRSRGENESGRVRPIRPAASGAPAHPAKQGY
jgi:hypothetical protein